MSKVRNEAAAVIAMQAATYRDHADGFDSIGERGQGDRMKRVAGEIELAAELLRNYGKNQKTEVPALESVGEDGTFGFKVGDRVITTDEAPRRVKQPFTIKEIKSSSHNLQLGSKYAIGTFDDGTLEDSGIWLKFVEHAPKEEPEELAAWERALLSPFNIGDWVEVVREGKIGWGHKIGVIGQVADTYFSESSSDQDAIFVKALFPTEDGGTTLVSLAHSPEALAPSAEQGKPDLSVRVGAKVKLNAAGREVFLGFLDHLPEVLTLKEKGNWWKTVETAPGLSGLHLNESEFEVIG